jgi:putative peptidoglycan lipid II flippase
MISHILGASWITDSFLVAFKIPNFFRRFFAEGAFHAAFVPEFSLVLRQQGFQSAQFLAQEVKLVLGFFLILLTIGVECFTPQVMGLIAPGLSGERLELSVTLTRITFPYIFLISLSALFAAVLNSIHRFMAAAVAPIILNLSMISALFWTSSNRVVYALALSVIIAGIGQLIWLWVLSARYGYCFVIRWPLLTPGVKRVIRKMIPGMVGAGVVQINVLLDLTFASFLSIGSLSYLYYADRLIQLPLSMLGIGVGTVLLPALSQSLLSQETQPSQDLQNQSITMGWRLSVPAAVGLMVLSTPIIRLIYGHGQFKELDIIRTSGALTLFAIGIPPYVLGKILNNFFFARHDTRTPVRVSLITIGAHILFNISLIQSLGHFGMALSTALAGWVQLIGLVYFLRRSHFFRWEFILLKDMGITIISSLIMGWILWKFSTSLHTSQWQEILHVFTLTVVGVGSYTLIHPKIRKSLIRFLGSWRKWVRV